MKKIFFLAAMIMISLFAPAQKIEVTEDNVKIGGDKHPVLTVTIYEADKAAVEKAWKSLMKDYKAKVTNKDEMFAENAVIDNISTKPIDIYATVTENKDNSILLTVAFDLGGAYLSSAAHPDKYKVAEEIIRNFAVNVSKDAVQTRLDDEKKKQKELESNLADLVKEKQKLSDAIDDYNKKIAAAQKKIETNVKDQETATKALEAQKNVVQDVQKKLDGIK